MVNAITGPCIEKVSSAARLPNSDLTSADAATIKRLTPGGGGVWFTAMDGVVIIDPDVDFACQVLGRDIDPDGFGTALEGWLEGADFALDGTLPMARDNERGLFLYGEAAAGGYISIHVSNLPNNYLGALVTRAERNPTARRLLNR